MQANVLLKRLALVRRDRVGYPVRDPEGCHDHPKGYRWTFVSYIGQKGAQASGSPEDE